MIIPDINLLLYAHITSFPKHAAAKKWWEAALSGDGDVGLVAPVIFGFIRISTNPRVFSPPMSVDVATAHVESWLARPRVVLLSPGPRHIEIALPPPAQAGHGGELDDRRRARCLRHREPGGALLERYRLRPFFRPSLGESAPLSHRLFSRAVMVTPFGMLAGMGRVLR